MYWVIYDEPSDLRCRDSNSRRIERKIRSPSVGACPKRLPPCRLRSKPGSGFRWRQLSLHDLALISPSLSKVQEDGSLHLVMHACSAELFEPRHTGGGRCACGLLGQIAPGRTWLAYSGRTARGPRVVHEVIAEEGGERVELLLGIDEKILVAQQASDS